MLKLLFIPVISTETDLLQPHRSQISNMNIRFLKHRNAYINNYNTYPFVCPMSIKFYEVSSANCGTAFVIFNIELVGGPKTAKCLCVLL